MAGTPQLSAKLPSCLWQTLLLVKAWDVDISSHSPGLACQQAAGDPLMTYLRHCGLCGRDSRDIRDLLVP